MTRSTADTYDKYWAAADPDVYDPRSRQRADVALGLLGTRRGRLLDVGCGRGVVAAAFRSAGFDVTGIDVSPTAVEKTMSRGVDASVVDITRDSLPSGFDVVVCFEVLEHLLDPLSALRKLASSTKDDGVLVVSLPNEFHLWCRLNVLFGRPHFAAHDFPHVRLFDRRAIARLFSDAGLRVLDERPIPVWPPRWSLQGLGRTLSLAAPGLFSISIVSLLSRR
jgi:2-polyprenyl-3-methyl-5-hydroxy-6-metoxy-1,4-benzoquinol methylase